MDPDQLPEPERPAAPPAPLRNDNPARDTWIASLLDPAFDRNHREWPERRDRYTATRAVADLAALPTLPEQFPSLWRVRALSAVARTGIYAQATVTAQRLTALRFALVARIDGARTYGPDGVTGCAERAFARVKGAPVPQVEDAAIDAEMNEFGGLWLDELGEVVIHRTNAPRRVYLPFPLLLPSSVL
jgi:hypothetical protein